jgi:putative ABC transport system substrate-binding protein
VKRREFILIVGGAAAWPLAAGAQQPAMPVTGFLNAASPGPLRQQIAAFHEGLKESGYVEGQNVAVEYRWAEGQYDRLPALAADLVRRQVSVIVAGGGAPVVLAAKAATTTIPKFLLSSPPAAILSGWASSPASIGPAPTSPESIISPTGSRRSGWDCCTKWFPRPQPSRCSSTRTIRRPKTVTRGAGGGGPPGVQLVVVHANTESDFDAAFSTVVQQRSGALLVCASPFFNTRREQLVVLAARHGLPTIYEWRDFAAAGGLMSYGTSLADAYRQAGVYAGRILKGAKPADLPIVQSTKFEFVINLNTAKALGLTIPPGLLAIADEVIE